MPPKFFLLYIASCFITSAVCEDTQIQHANHIFNAIHSSMRQWGSSLNHNGMSFFLATVPAGTQLYHGTSKSDPIKGTEWLAFEPEHSLIFAQPRRGPPHREPPPRHELRPANRGDIPRHPPPSPGYRHEPPPHHGPPSQSPFHKHSDDNPQPGYLHTYAPTHPLRLLYVDGMSAGKTSNGTLDTQDFLLLNLTDLHNGPGGELARANGLCNLSSTLWEGKIDGILRMEGGFEIILCDFERDLEVKDIMTVTERGHGFHDGGLLGGWRYYQAITNRYHGIGGRRVEIDYENFVSVFEYEGLDLWTNDVSSDVPMPRLQNVPSEDLLKIKNDITCMILNSEVKSNDDRMVNWQEVADMLVARYSAPLHYLHTNHSMRDCKEDFAAYLSVLLRPFVDHTDRNSTLETERCIAQFIPPLPLSLLQSSNLAYRTVHVISSEICSTLLIALDIASQSISHSLSRTPPPRRALDLVDELVSYLQWTTWKQCGTCQDEEICIVPIWPMGTLEDHANPMCRNQSGVVGHGEYWGRVGGPRPGDSQEQEHGWLRNEKGVHGSGEKVLGAWMGRVEGFLRMVDWLW